MLHGWGADAEDLIPIGLSIRDILGESLEIVALRAPDVHLSGFGKQWYSLFPPDWKEASVAVEHLEVRLQAFEWTKIPLKKTVILGFSQGGAMALASGWNLPFAGLISCSGYSHPGWDPGQNQTPVFLAHGCFDNVVPIEANKQMQDLFRLKNISFSSEIFEGGHEIPPLIVNKISEEVKKFLR